MKNGILTLLLFLLFINGFSQPLKPSGVPGKYSPGTIKQEKLIKALRASEIIPEYPAHLIMNFVSVEIIATCGGKTMIAASTDDKLSAEQKNILNTVDLGTRITVNFNYLYNRVQYWTAVVPEVEAVYPRGDLQMAQYLKENISDKISETTFQQIQFTSFKFTVNEDGKVENVQLSETTGDSKTDELLLEAINKMPKWKPAENSNGIKVKQTFEFSIGNPGGGC